jgi:DNA-directed RNA polymerase subunit RPC12/RpoP
MTPLERKLVTIAKLALEVLDELDTPPATATEEPSAKKAVKPKRKVRRKPQRRHASARRLRKTPKATAPLPPPLSPVKHRGRPKGAKDYICLTCKHGFRDVEPTGCANCGAKNFILKKDYNPDTL